MRLLSTCAALCYCFFLEKSFCKALVLLLVNMHYLYEYWVSDGGCKFIDISRYNIAEDDPVAVRQVNNRLEVVRLGHLFFGGSFKNFSFSFSRIFQP